MWGPQPAMQWALTSVGVQHSLLREVPHLHTADERQQSGPGITSRGGSGGRESSPEVSSAADRPRAARQDVHRLHHVVVLVLTELIDDEGLLLVQLPQLHGACGAQRGPRLTAGTGTGGRERGVRPGGARRERAGGDGSRLPESEPTRIPLSATQRRSATPASVWTPAVQKPSLGARRGSANTQMEPAQQRPLSPEAPSSSAPSAGRSAVQRPRCRSPSPLPPRSPPPRAAGR